jgi:predicted nucleic acid-binding protein
VAGLRGVGGTLVLDADGLSKLAAKDRRAQTFFEAARAHRGRVITAASTLPEVLRGGPRDAAVHHWLKLIAVVPLDKELGRAAGELLGRTGLSGHRCALDALLAVVALAQPRPVVLLTSDPRDLEKLTYEPERPRVERVAVVTV